MQINGQTRITGLFGDPVAHSLSPAMHNAAYRALRLHYAYLPFHVTPAALPQAVASIRALNLAGVNVTVPHKETVIAHLDHLDPSARRCGAVNTIVNQNGTLTGYNTDGAGFIDSLRENRFEPHGSKAAILGAGGSARAIAAALLDAGVTHITLINRTPEKAIQLAQALGGHHQFTVIPLTAAALPLKDVSLVVNTLATSFRQGEGWLTDLSAAAGALFYDLRYGRMPSDFLTYAQEQKSPGQDGLGMLLHQGARAFTLFTGTEAPLQVMKNALHRYFS
jgi:shikimate dehydrogenase